MPKKLPPQRPLEGSKKNWRKRKRILTTLMRLIRMSLPMMTSPKLCKMSRWTCSRMIRRCKMMEEIRINRIKMIKKNKMMIKAVNILIKMAKLTNKKIKIKIKILIKIKMSLARTINRMSKTM